MTPLERAASALWRAVIDESSIDPAILPIRHRGIPARWEDERPQVRDRFIAQARAVLTAIREPSEAVEIAIAKAIEDSLPCNSASEPPDAVVMVEYGVSKVAVSAMIDAMLEEG